MTQRINGVSAIAKAFVHARAEGRPALLTYITLGYPSSEASLALVPALEQAGADIIELGIPFSDPIADGPTIQAASQTALLAGITPSGCLDLAAELRARGVRVPFIAMGYYNPILTYGLTAFVSACSASGIDGLIVPDLPLEEAEDLAQACRAHDLALIYLVAPNTGDERLQQLAEATTGFLYVVSRLGTTGAGQTSATNLQARLAQVRQAAHTPVAVGFGITRPDQARALAGSADGVIVGSAIVERMTQGTAAVTSFVAELAAALAAK